MEATTWASIVAGLSSPDMNCCVKAAARLHAESEASDAAKLLELLCSDDFFVREAAAWPLAELVGPKVLGELFSAYQRGFDEGHDNDGFTAALLEIPALHPEQTRISLRQIVASASEPTRGHAVSLLEFCTPAAEAEGNDA